MTRQHVTLSATVDVQRSQVQNEFEATFLAPGVHNGYTFLAEEIARGAETMEGQPANLNHSREVEDEVGYARNVKAVEGKLRGTIVLSPETAKFGVAKAFIENRQRANKVPEVSVGVFFTLEEMTREDGESILIARDLEFDHIAIVTRGACSPEKGCGVGLAKENTNMEPEGTEPTPEEAEAPETPEVAPEETTEAPAAEETPEEPAADEPAPEEEEPETPEEAHTETSRGCGCHELEQALLAEKEARDTAEKALAEFRESLPERLGLVQKAHEFGLDVTGAEDLAVIKADLAKAERVAAHLSATGRVAPATGPSGPAERTNASLADDDVGRRAAAMLRHGGINVA